MSHARSACHSPLHFAVIVFLCSATFSLRAEIFDNFTYTDRGTEITITSWPKALSGPVVIPATIAGKPVTEIGSNAFAYSGITSISFPSGPLVVRDGAFRGCHYLTSVSIPARTGISEGAFAECPALAAVEVDAAHPGYTSIDGVLYDKTKQTLILCPAGRTGDLSLPSTISQIRPSACADCIHLTSVSLPNGLFFILSDAFRNCPGLTSIVLPASLRSMDFGCFAYCSGLTSVTFAPGINTNGSFNRIPTNAFLGCTSLASITLPSSTAYISSGAFQNCTSLTSFTIPQGIRTIDSFTFSGCTSLGSIFIPSTVVEILDDAFANCRSLAAINFPVGLQELASDSFKGCESLTFVVVPSGIREILAFSGCSGLASIILPAGITRIADRAFNGCSSLSSIFIPPGVTDIEELAFQNCHSLTSITIPAATTEVIASAFNGCTALTSIHVDPANPAYSSLDGVLFNKQQTQLIRYPGGRSGDYAIPSGTTGTALDAFEGCTGLTGLTIPATLAGMDTPVNCGALTFIDAESGNVDFRSVDGVLFSRSNELVLYPTARTGPYTVPAGISVIGNDAFARCTGLTGITFPDSLHFIEAEAFSHCTGLTSVDLATISRIGNAAFSHCSGLTSVLVPAGLTSMQNPFPFCSNLKAIDVEAGGPFRSVDGVLFGSGLLQYPAGKTGSFVIPSGIFSISKFAFAGCTALDKVVIPASVGSIGETIFEGCTGLEEVTFLGEGLPLFGYLMTPGTHAPALRVYHFAGKRDFTAPFWHGYRTVNMGNYTPVKDWLVSHLLSHDEVLFTDSDNDGLPLFMEYALRFDPTKPSASGLPAASLTPEGLNLRFYAGATGVTYNVEVSEDLQNWTTAGVSLSNPDTLLYRIATVPRDSPARYLRLAISVGP